MFEALQAFLLNWSYDITDKYGLLGVVIVVFIGTTPIPIPAEIISLSFLKTGVQPWFLATISAIGATFGGLITYYIGMDITKFAKLEKKYRKQIKIAHAWLERHGELAIAIFAMTFLPYDAIALLAGSAKMDKAKFIIATFLGRIVRYTAVMYFAYTILNNI